MDSINDNMGTYVDAASVVGIPWQSLAAIHYRESNLRVKARNIGGPFMLDCGRDGTDEFDRRIRQREREIYYKYFLFPPVPKVKTDFKFAALCAADELRGKVRGRLYYSGGG